MFEKEEVDITTGLADDEYVQVLSGLSGGEKILVTTETKQNTIRNGKNKSDREFENDFGGGMPGGMSGGMPGKMSGNEGNSPSMPDNMRRPDSNNTSGS